MVDLSPLVYFIKVRIQTAHDLTQELFGVSKSTQNVIDLFV